MKKILASIFALFVSLCATQAGAQILSGIEGMPPYKLGVTVGLNVPSFSNSDCSSTMGVQAGLNLMLDGSSILQNTFGRVELKYSMKGAYFENNSPGNYWEERFTTHYLELPVHLGYAWYVNENLSVMAEGGPYVALGLWGERNSTFGKGETASDQVFSGKLNCSRFDAGLGVQLGAMILNDYQLHVAYDFGFVNLGSFLLQNRNLSVGFTYFFE